MSDGKRRCAGCQHEFIPHKLPLTFSRDEWKRDPSFISYGTKFEFNSRTDRIQQTKGYKALTKIRLVMIKDVPEIFS